jgi:phosphoribosylanthranilate isomerase
VTLVKICGMTSPEDGQLAARAGAAAVGMVFWPGSRRCVDVARARRIAAALPPFVLRVGVFVDAPLEEMQRVAEQVELDLLQLHGNEPPELFGELPRRALKAIRVGPSFDEDEVTPYLGCAAGILLDSGAGSLPGGTGESFEWSRARAVRRKAPFLVVAGGLNADNVARAIEELEPDAVDVTSGVEGTPGHKDPLKVWAFLDAVRRTEK